MLWQGDPDVGKALGLARFEDADRSLDVGIDRLVDGLEKLRRAQDPRQVNHRAAIPQKRRQIIPQQVSSRCPVDGEGAVPARLELAHHRRADETQTAGNGYKTLCRHRHAPEAASRS